MASSRVQVCAARDGGAVTGGCSTAYRVDRQQFGQPFGGKPGARRRTGAESH